MIFDVNNQIGNRRNKPDVTAESLISAMDKAKVDRAVVFCFPEKINNQYIAKAVKKYPQRLTGLYTINPLQEDNLDNLKKALENGFSGVRLDAVRHGFVMNDIALLAPIMHICEKYDVPVWAYGAAEIFSSPILFQELAANFPKIPIIMGWMGFSYEATSAFGVAKRNKNIYLDTTGHMFANYQRVIASVDAHQILLGTGTPEAGYFELEIEKVREATSDPEVQALILGNNAARLFKIHQ